MLAALAVYRWLQQGKRYYGCFRRRKSYAQEYPSGLEQQ